MRKLRAFKTLGRYLLIGAVLIGAPMSITAVEADDTSFGVPISPNSHLYAYFVINGMARGAFLEGKLNPKNVQPLLQIDEASRKVVLHALNAQTIRSDFEADRILTQYLDMLLH